MIIQCKQCRTKFRFDDSLMEGDGVWLRCSRCQHVFFQDNIPAAKPELEAVNEENLLPVKEPAFVPGPGMEGAASASSGKDEDVALFLDDVIKAKGNLEEKTVPEIEKPVAGEDAEEEKVEKASATAFRKEQKAAQRSFWRALRIFVWVVLVIAVIPAIIYFFVFPDIGDRLLKVVNKYVDTGIREPARPEIVTGQVKLQDIRQRILTNYVAGSIRVVEGTAVNQADYSISRIAVKGEIVDAYAVVQGERISYAGNVLSDEELATLPEEEIFKRLSQPEGRNNSNDKIMPNGMIPFMIVFSREPAGVIKTTVRTVGAERLL